jgi:hypothetical protein
LTDAKRLVFDRDDAFDDALVEAFAGFAGRRLRAEDLADAENLPGNHAGFVGFDDDLGGEVGADFFDETFV